MEPVRGKNETFKKSLAMLDKQHRRGYRKKRTEMKKKAVEEQKLRRRLSKQEPVGSALEACRRQVKASILSGQKLSENITFKQHKSTFTLSPLTSRWRSCSRVWRARSAKQWSVQARLRGSSSCPWLALSNLCWSSRLSLPATTSPPPRTSRT